MTLRARIAAFLAVACAAVLLFANPASASTPERTWCAKHANLAILGASSETGYGTTGYPSGAETFQRTVYGWVTRFTDSLHSEWGTNVQNYSHNGALVADYLPGGRWSITTGAVADITTVQPDLVIINLGGNELWSQADPATFRANLGTLVDNIRAARPGVDILMGIYAELKWQPNEYGGTTQKYTWAQYGAGIYDTAVAKGTALIDMRQYIPSAASNNPPNPSPWTSDGVHLNDTGNLAEYGGWWGWVSSLASIC